VYRKILSERRQAIEDRFFKEQESTKLAELRSKRDVARSRSELRSVSGIEDESLLDTLTELGIGAGDLSALGLVPLIRVAWADGFMKEPDRQAVLLAAKRLLPETHGQPFLDSWLDKPPSPLLFKAWGAYTRHLLRNLDEDQVLAIKVRIVELARDVGFASGGFVGMMSFSHSAEEAALDEIEHVFDL
jgi:hypothetical protein